MSYRFFIPDGEFKEWIKEYAGDRIIIDVGAGTGEFALEMKEIGAKMMCIEPYPLFDVNTYDFIKKGIQWWPNPVEESENLIKGLGNKVIFLFARPCHSKFVETCLDFMANESEGLYITLPENVERYDDLGKWRNHKQLLNHKGTSKDNEVVYSIKKWERNLK